MTAVLRVVIFEVNMSDTNVLMRRAWSEKIVIPAFNIPHLPMLAPVVAALKECETFGLIEVARLEWEKFKSGSMRAVKEMYNRSADGSFTRLHLDHIPVIDEDNQRVDYLAIIRQALALGYESVMVNSNLSRTPMPRFSRRRFSSASRAARRSSRICRAVIAISEVVAMVF